MFDLRYHVASLAAVFVALLIGILVGVGLTGKVDDAEKSALRRQVSDLREDARLAGERRGSDARQQAAARAVAAQGYPLLMQDLLRGRRIALLFVGSVDSDVRRSVTAALEDADAVALTRMRAIEVPIDEGEIDRALAAKPALADSRGPQKLRELGNALAQEFVIGGDAPTWDALTTSLVESQRGRAGPPVQGVVIVRSSSPQTGPTARFLRGFYAGLAGAAAPAVAVQDSSDDPDSLKAFDRAGLSTVDNVDTESGRYALALLLAGAKPGNYGLSADDLFPAVEKDISGG
jgi:copper transport outer membrane protein MctB